MSEIEVLARSISRKMERGVISQSEGLAALAFLRHNGTLWEPEAPVADEVLEEDQLVEDEEDILDDEEFSEITPNEAWDLVRWQEPCYDVYLWGLDKAPIRFKSLNKAAKARAVKALKLSGKEASLLNKYIKRYFALLDMGAEEESHWLVKRSSYEASAYLYGMLPFKRAFYTGKGRKIARDIERHGSRVPLFNIMKAWTKILDKAEVVGHARKLVGADIKRLWELWKLSRFLEADARAKNTSRQERGAIASNEVF
jgi:hypothetical protein